MSQTTKGNKSKKEETDRVERLTEFTVYATDGLTSARHGQSLKRVK
jgi:hypothetical protein